MPAPSLSDILLCASTGVRSDDMTLFDVLRAQQMQGGGYPETTITGVPPISFKADGTPLTSVTIKGNGQQSGTPSPQNILPFDGTGERTENLFDISNLEAGIYLAANGNKYGNVENGVRCGTKIKASPNTSYTLSAHSDLNISLRILEWSNGVFVTQTPKYNISGDVSLSITTDATTTSIAFNIEGANAQYATKIMLNLGSTTLPYEPYGWQIPLTNASVTTPLYLGEQQTVRRVKKLVLTGEETLSDVGGNAPYRIMLSDIVSTTDRNIVLFLSSHYLAVSNNTSWAQYNTCVSWAFSGGNKNVKCLQFRDTNQATVTDFKTYLSSEYSAGTPVTIWYVLAEPETGIVNEPLMKIGDYCDTLTTDTPIPTAKGSNTMTVDTTLQPTSVSVTGHIKQS